MPAVSYDAVCQGLIKFHAGFKSTFSMSAGRRQKAPLAQSLLGALLHDWQLAALCCRRLVCMLSLSLSVSLYFYCSNQIERIVSGFVSCPRKRIHLRNTSWSICIHICQRLYWVLCSVCVFHFHNFACLPQDVAHCTVVRYHTVRTRFCLTYDRIKAQRLPLMQMPWRVYPPAPVCSAYRLPWSAFAFVRIRIEIFVQSAVYNPSEPMKTSLCRPKRQM